MCKVWFKILLLWAVVSYRAQAAALTWDANGATAPNPSDGNGNWLTAGNWWNSSNNVNGSWTATTPDSAVFGAGTPGTYLVSLGGGNVYASNIVFSTSGYTVTNGTLTLLGNNLPVTASSSVIATLKSALVIGISSTWQVNNAATLSL